MGVNINRLLALCFGFGALMAGFAGVLISMCFPFNATMGLDYTVIGANVNLAQRLESNAPVEGILISNPVFEKVKEEIETKPAGKIKAKGFEEEIEVHEVAIGE